MGKLQNWVEGVIPDAQAVFGRFPLVIILVAAFTIVLLIETNFGGLSDEMMMRLIGGLILAAYVSVILILYGEGRGKSVSIIIKVATVSFCLFGGYFFRQMAFITPAAIGASILFLGNAPFWRKERDDVSVWDFTHKLWTAVLFTVAGSMIYVMGIFAIMGALESLFGINMSKIVTDWMLPIGLGFLAPMAWLSMLPRHNEEDGDSLRNPGFISRAVGFLGAWILAPLTLIYAVILLAYGVKILLTQSVPNGEIAQLVTPFLIIGALTWLILDPPFIQKKRLARLYTKLWFPLSMPAALLLAYAVFVRIGQYGWTIERYLLVLASVWAIGIAAWFIFRGETKRDIRIIPGLAALLLAIASIGPWGADAVSSFSQSGRLKSALVANQMLDADGYLKPVSELNITDNGMALKAKGGLQFLVRHKKKGKLIKFIPNEQRAEFLKNMAKGKHWKQSTAYKRFGLNNIKGATTFFTTNSFEYNGGQAPIAVKGYDYVSPLQSHNIYRKNSRRSISYKLGDYQIVTINDGVEIFDVDGIKVNVVNIWEWLREQPVDNTDNTINLNPNFVLYENEDTKILLHIKYARYEKFAENSNMRYVIIAKNIGINE